MLRARIATLLTLLICLVSCEQNKPSSAAPENAKQKISFEKFEDITENHPELYISNPDSFLNSLHLQPQTDEEKEIYAYGLLYMAYSLREQGNHFKSIQYYERALNFVKEHSIQNLDFALYIIKPLATLYIHVDDHQKAISLLENLLADYPPTAYEQKAGLVNNLANAYLYNMDFEKADSLVTDILPHLNESLTKALLYNTASQIKEQQQDTATSSRFNTLAIRAFEKHKLYGDTLVWYCSALTQAAELNNNISQAQKSIDILERHFPHSQYRTKGNACLSLANIYLALKNWGNALQQYKLSAAHFRKSGEKYVLDYKYTYALLGQARCFARQKILDSAFYYYEWAIENDFRTQQLITSAQDQIRNNRWNKDILEELIALYLSAPSLPQQTYSETLLWCIELSKARLLINEIHRSDQWTAADDKLKEALQQIRLLYQQYDATVDPKLRNAYLVEIEKLKTDFQLSERYFEKIHFNPKKEDFLQRVQQADNSYYAYYIHKDNKISILNSSRKKISFYQVNDTSFLSKIELLKKEYFGDSPNSYNNNPTKYREESSSIAKRLLPNLPETECNIFLSLDGSLYGLPFDALYHHNSFLVQQYNMAYLNSFLLFDFLHHREEAQKAAVAVFYRSDYPSPLPKLPFVDQEVKNLKKTFKTESYSPLQQNDKSLKQAFNRSNLIHIAAHTILDSTEAPYLYLHQPISINQLRFYEIKTPLVFLSACNTGSGKPLPSEGTASIQRVFLSKNVPSVISTYWFANDETMLQLTAKFYDQLKKCPYPMEALAEAKRQYLKEGGVLQANPWYWANINYTGINNEVGLKETSNLLPLACVISMTLLGLFFLRRKLTKV